MIALECFQVVANGNSGHVHTLPSGQTVVMAENPTATLAVMADHLERYHEQLGDMLPHYLQTDQAEMVNAVVEAERALRVAARLVRTAGKVAARTAH